MVVAAAGLAIALFYTCAGLAILLLSLWIACELAFAVAAARVGAIGFVKPFIERHGQLVLLFFRAIRLRRRAEFQVSLDEPEAPRLFARLRDLSQRFSVPTPRRVLIEMSANAWVLLKGMRRGANATTLGLGYDLVAGLSERELEAVLAHEMAHAKFVHRGYKRFINIGTAYAARFTGSLSALVEAYRRAKKTFHLGEWLLGVFDPVTRLVVRLVAAYSRQDEFEADLGAAEIYGAAPLRSALVKLDHIAAKTARISWNERVARLQEENGFGIWLAEELVTNDASAGAAAEVFDRYSTHPSLNDRLAALPDGDDSSSPSPPAIELFADPDAVAKRVVTEIHRIAALEEAQSTREQLKWLKQIRRRDERQGRRILGGLFCFVGLVALILWPIVGELGLFWAAVVFGAISVPFFWFGRHRAKGRWPVPDYETLHAAWIVTEEPVARESREKIIQEEINATVSELDKEAKVAALTKATDEALVRCDYQRALLATRRLQELAKNDPEVLVAASVALAGLRNYSDARDFLATVVKRTGLQTPNLLWGAAWTLTLCGEWQSAEPMLEMLRRSEPENTTYLALLATCQGQIGKRQIAILNAQRAFEALPQSKHRLELLADLLIQSGRLVEAEARLRQAGSIVETEAPLIESMIWLLLTKRDFVAAEIWIGRLRVQGIPGHTNVSLAGMYEKARRDDIAETYYLAALAQGFYPAAEFGLARLAQHRGDSATARSRALSALDMARPLGNKAAGPVALFDPVLQFLIQLEASTTTAKAWVCILDPDLEIGAVSGYKFLVFGCDENHAEHLLLPVLTAMNPKAPPLTNSALQIRRAPDDRQPIGAVRPGVQSYWK